MGGIISRQPCCWEGERGMVEKGRDVRGKKRKIVGWRERG